MISDVLHQAVRDMDLYLDDEVFTEHYVGALRDQILNLRVDMLHMLAILDTPPGAPEPSKEQVAEWSKRT